MQSTQGWSIGKAVAVVSTIHSHIEPVRSRWPHLPAPAGFEPTGKMLVSSQVVETPLPHAPYSAWSMSRLLSSQGYRRYSVPPLAAYCHCNSLGKKPPSQTQNANAS